MKYKILSATSIYQLIREVQSAIDQGYIPTGGVSYADVGGGTYMQSIIYKHE